MVNCQLLRQREVFCKMNNRPDNARRNENRRGISGDAVYRHRWRRTMATLRATSIVVSYMHLPEFGRDRGESCFPDHRNLK